MTASGSDDVWGDKSRDHEVWIDHPRQLRSLCLHELTKLAEKIRQKILTTCLKNGGHLSSSLGAVELAIALHRVEGRKPRKTVGLTRQ